MKKKLSYYLFIAIFMMFFGGAPIFAGHSEASDPFPAYPCIKPNVAFWEKVFAKYSTTQGIIHDRRNLNIIFEVIKLVKKETRHARKINKDRIKRAKQKYKNILIKLARDPSRSTPIARRVAALFGPKANRATFQRAARNIRCQVGLKDRFREGLISSGAYLGEIKRILRSYGLPVDLAYLPHVESSFNPKAYSKFGAAGIWQFIRSTGKRFLALDDTLDERRDPIRSTHAAARLLKENYEKLGSWPMAITAYNHGAAGMLRAKRSKGSYAAIFKGYRSRLFKFASRNFYAEFLAAMDVAKNHTRYFGKLKLKKPQRYRKVVVEGYVSLKDLARHFKVDTALLRSLNPSLRHSVYRGQKYVPKGYTLRLPLKTSQGSLKLYAKLPPEIYKSRQKRSRFYKVQKGDTAGKIAKMYGVRLSDLIVANNLNSRATIYARQNLRLPGPNEKTARLAEVKSLNSRPVGTSENTPKTKANSKMTAKSEPSPSQAGRRHIDLRINLPIVTSNLFVERVITTRGKRQGIIRVEAEETLGHYADWLGIATLKIRRLNGFRYGKLIRPNQQVKIPLDKVSKEQFEKKRFGYHKQIEEDFFGSFKIENVKTYHIKNGDNIWTLCHKVFQVPFWLINKYNPNLDINALQPSQKLMIPVAEKIG